MYHHHQMFYIQRYIQSDTGAHLDPVILTDLLGQGVLPLMISGVV